MSSSNELILEVNNVSKNYRNFKALQNVSLSVNKGDIFGIVGRNGAGKTTLIRIITGLQKQSGGSYKAYTKGFGSISAIVDAPAIRTNLTAYQNLEVQAILLGINKESRKALIEKTLERVGLEGTLNKKAGDFSLGMRQRLAIGVTLLSNPELIILDEPANGLDPQGMIDIRNIILKLNNEDGITFIVSSHILSELDKMATRYLFLEQGCVLKEVSADEVHTLNKHTYRYVVSKTNGVVELLKEKFNIDEVKILSNVEFEIEKPIELLQLANALQEIDVKIESFTEVKGMLESYFINLLNDSAKKEAE